MLQKFEDLRFSIGAFFLIVGVLLILAGFMYDDRSDLNFLTGGGLIAFAVVALALALRKPIASK